MSVIVMEGFEHPFFAVNEQVTGWATIGSTGTVQQVDDVEHGKRIRFMTPTTSGNSYQTTYTRRYVRKVGADWGNYFVMGVRVRISGHGGRIAGIHTLNESGAIGTNLIEFSTGSGGVCLLNDEPVASGLIMETGIDNYLELEVDKVALVCRAWLNNQLVGNVPLDPDVAEIGYWFGIIRTITVGGTSSSICEMDDHYAADGNGAINRSRLGRVKVVMRLPQADQVAEFERLGGASNASQVNDLGNPTTDSTYVYSNTEGAVDLYTNSDPLPLTDAPVLAVAVTVVGRKEGPDARAVAPMIKSGLADEVGDRINLYVATMAGGTSVFDLNPETMDAWTREEAENASFGHTLVV